MPDMEHIIAEAMGFSLIEKDGLMQRMADEALLRYGDAKLSLSELEYAAGGNMITPKDNQRKCDEPFIRTAV